MTDYTLTEERKKRITEKLLDECWHDYEVLIGNVRRCSKCDKLGGNNRSFLTPDDMYAVRAKLREKGLWGEFYWYGPSYADDEIKDIFTEKTYYPDYMASRIFMSASHQPALYDLYLRVFWGYGFALIGLWLFLSQIPSPNSAGSHLISSELLNLSIALHLQKLADQIVEFLTNHPNPPRLMGLKNG